ncbi:YaaW family protein [Alkalinema pantanalense CENA528]|uniref:YaaW family protein n=1 Tax=Alkalinema pantanalense TaxID=1620705 RepID=UPI003D6F9AF4
MDELRAALELATDDELRELTEILFRPKFNPLDYLNKTDPLDIQALDREDWMDELEDRFRFLAADGMTVLQRKTHCVSYRQALLQVCRYLRLPYQVSMSTMELEAEIFLHLLNRAWKKLPEAEQVSLTKRVQRSLSHTSLIDKLPQALQKDPMSLVIKGGSAIAVSSVVKPLLLQLIARQFALHFARYHVANSTLAAGGLATVSQLQTQFTMRMAQYGMTVNAARYGAVRTAFSFLGPAMWTWFIADLGWRSISTNYARIIPTIFALAQIRLTRGNEDGGMVMAYSS